MEQKTIEQHLEELGYGKLYTNTLARIIFFREIFRETFTENEISTKELDECVAYSFGIYGQEHVYGMFSIIKNKSNDTPLSELFKSFMKAFEDTIPDTAAKLKPKDYINLFLEYTFSLLIKAPFTA